MLWSIYHKSQTHTPQHTGPTLTAWSNPYSLAPTMRINHNNLWHEQTSDGESCSVCPPAVICHFEALSVTKRWNRVPVCFSKSGCHPAIPSWSITVAVWPWYFYDSEWPSAMKNKKQQSPKACYLLAKLQHRSSTPLWTCHCNLTGNLQPDSFGKRNKSKHFAVMTDVWKSTCFCLCSLAKK